MLKVPTSMQHSVVIAVRRERVECLSSSEIGYWSDGSGDLSTTDKLIPPTISSILFVSSHFSLLRQIKP